MQLLGLRVNDRRHGDLDELGMVLIPDEELHEFVRIARPRGIDHAIERGRRRVGRQRRDGRLVADQVVDLVVKDQRQAGEAQEQQEQGAGKAGPAMDRVPGSDPRRRQHLGHHQR
jgi:hypothetical protein